MKKSLVLIFSGIMCVLLFTAGCTSSPAMNPPTPAATTAAPVASLPEITATITPAPQALPWSGTWNTTWLDIDGNQTVSIIPLTQVGTKVSGNYSFSYPEEGTFTGSINASANGNTLSGTYTESDDDLGYFVFELSEDKNSFTGRWIHAPANQSALAHSTRFWNGVRQ